MSATNKPQGDRGRDSLQKWWRRKRLASDSRAGEFARARAREQLYKHLGRHWWRYLAVTVVFSVVIYSISSAVVPSDFFRGLVVGVGCTAVVAVQWMWIVQVSGAAPRAMGEQAELWTAAALRRVKQWRLVNGVRLGGGDIDHVLIGAGGIYAVETKWTSSPMTPRWVSGACQQAARGARQLTLWSSTRPYGPATPVVVVWGPEARSISLPAVHDGVWIVAGSDWDDWWHSRGGEAERLSPEEVDAVWEVLSERCQATDPMRRKAPPSLSELANWGMGTAVLGVLAFMATGGLFAALPIGWAFAAAMVSLLGIILVRRRLDPPWRYLATAWLTGAVAALALMVMAMITGMPT